MDDDRGSGLDDPHASAEPGDRDDLDAGSSLIDYRRLIQRALRAVPREALRLAAEHGLPGDHHFFIDFRTDHPSVEMPARLYRQFPSSMRMVLQHQFWNLEVEDDAFLVDLRFGGEYARLRVPFAALTAFVDPAAQLALAFDDDPGDEGGGTSDEHASDEHTSDAHRGGDDDLVTEPATGATVVSLDAFRKR